MLNCERLRVRLKCHRKSEDELILTTFPHLSTGILCCDPVTEVFRPQAALGIGRLMSVTVREDVVK